MIFNGAISINAPDFGMSVIDMGTLATIEVLGFVSAISIYIAVQMVRGAKAELAAKKNQAAGN